MRKQALLCLFVAVVFATYSVYGVTLTYASPKTAVVEVKTGALTGKITNMDEAPLSGKSIRILDATGKEKYQAVSNKEGNYSIKDIASGTYTLVIADFQKVSIVVKPDASNFLINAMVPETAKPYAGGAIGDMSTALGVAITGGVVLISTAIYGITQYDSDTSGLSD